MVIARCWLPYFSRPVFLCPTSNRAGGGAELIPTQISAMAAVPYLEAIQTYKRLLVVVGECVDGDQGRWEKMGTWGRWTSPPKF